MHLLIIVETIGGYHAARLAATDRLFRQNGDRITALQVRASTSEHPWGSVPISFHVVTSPHPEDDWETLLDQLQPDAVAIPGWGFWYSKRALDWCRSHHKPALMFSESKADDAPRYWMKELYKKWRFVRHFSSALVGSEAHRSYLESLGMPRERIFLGYDSVDNDFFEQQTTLLRAQNSLHPELPSRPYWLTVTRMIPRKNLSFLLDAYAGYRQEIGVDYAWDLALCGSGMEEETLKTKAKKLNIEPFVHFSGFKTYLEIPKWYAFAQALIHPALQEQWGLVVNEACASGLPILCSDTLGAKELVMEEVNGLQFNPTSVTSLIQAMTRFHRLSIEQRHQMGLQSRKIIEGYHPDRFARGLREAFQSAKHQSG
ncbi:MAG: glycosyltransferase family 4 protein [Verrucomicrobiota bacterium]